MPMEPIVFRRPPNVDEFMLGFARNDDAYDREEWVLKGIPQTDRDKHCYMVGAHGCGKTKNIPD